MQNFNKYIVEHLKKRFSFVSGWGLNKWAKVKTFIPKNLEELVDFVKKSTPGSILARGLGRSYGDAAQLDGKTVINLKNFKTIKLNKSNSTLTVGGGVTLKEIIKEIVPRGFFLPVVPGTSNITIGGAVASDVHGKNHYQDGSFGNHIIKISLIDGNGNIQELTPFIEKQKEKFWATVGGIGLTGIVYEVKIKLISISSSLIEVNTKRFNDIEDLITEMEKTLIDYKYSVAWIDSLNKKFRGVLTRGNHLKYESLNLDEQTNPLFVSNIKDRSKPKFLSKIFLNYLTVKIFNTLWFYKSPKDKISKHESISNFFHPLDKVKDWNKIYGSKGFIQYQFFVPNNSKEKIMFVLDYFKRNRIPCFLTVLKKFGKSNSSHLSFPDEGWTLTTDIPNCVPQINKILNFLDNEIAKSGGKIYLTKDSMQSADIFKKTYPNLDKWKKVKNELDPEFKFISDISKRLNFF